jgi:hypothetical protein
MANLIQIKRSALTAEPTTLEDGELAFSSNGNVLFIGDGQYVIPIAGKRYPGQLTANQALVANGTGYMDEIKVANLVPTKIYANGSSGNGQLLLANSTGGLYWGTPTNALTDLSDVEISGTTGAQILVANSTGVFRNVSVSGDITIDANGVATISADAIALGTDTTGNYVATITAGNGLSGNGTTEGSTPTVAVVAGGGIVANSTGVFANVDSSTIEISGGALRVKDDGIALGTKTTGNYVATITAGNGISGSGSAEGSTPTIAVVANNGIVSNSTGVFVKAGTGVVVNATGVHVGQDISTTGAVTFQDLTVNGNSIIGSDGSDVVSFKATVNTDIMPSTNATYNIGNNTIRWNEVHAANIHSVSGYFDGNVQISGNLVVSGNVTTINVSTISVSDPMIYLAGNNYSSDLVDIGFVGNYNDGATNRHAGLVRHASDDTFYLFKNYTPEPDTNVINTGHASFRKADLVAYLNSGGLVSNSSAVTLTANSTVAVNMTANSLSLTTALPGTSGGTGLASYTAEDILVANSSNGFRKLSIGTSGKVLQSNGTALIYATLDGGTF